MPEIPDVTFGEVVASEWGNDIRSRTVQRYDTEAIRDAQNPTPEQGDLAYIADVGRLEMFHGVNWGSGFLGRQGSASNPTFIFRDGGLLGMYMSGTNRLGFTALGVERMTISASQVSPKVPVFASSGNALAPGYAFTGDSTIGLFLRAVGQLGISGNIYFDSADAWPTTGLAANMYVDASPGNGLVFVSTSARRFKENIEPAPQLADLDLEPVTFRHKEQQTDHIGFIADDLPDPRMIEYDEDGEARNYDLRAVVAVLAAKVNALTARVEALEA